MSDWSNTKFVAGSYQVPYTVNFYNLILSVPLGSSINSRDGTKIFVKTLYYRINVKSINRSNPYNSIAMGITKPCIRAITAIPRKASVNVVNLVAPHLPADAY